MEIVPNMSFHDLHGFTLNDNGENVDCIIVLGSIKAAQYRVPAAVKAFFTGRSGKIMLCGGKIRNFSGESMTEAENMYKKALESGVPEESIMIEKNSHSYKCISMSGR